MKQLVILLVCLTFFTFNSTKDVEKSLNGPETFIQIISNNADSLGLNEHKTRAKAKDVWKDALSSGKRRGRNIPLYDSFQGNKTALLIVDMQKSFVKAIPDAKRIIPNINSLARYVRSHGGNVIWIRYTVLKNSFRFGSIVDSTMTPHPQTFLPGHRLFEISDSLDVKGNDLHLFKNRDGATHSTLEPHILEVLERRGIENIVVSGLSTELCVGSTARGIVKKGYPVIIAWDGTIAPERMKHEEFLARFWTLHGEVLLHEQIKRLLK